MLHPSDIMAERHVPNLGFGPTFGDSCRRRVAACMMKNDEDFVLKMDNLSLRIWFYQVAARTSLMVNPMV